MDARTLVDDLPPLEVLDVGSAEPVGTPQEPDIPSPTWRWVVAGVAVLTMALAAAWLATRGSGDVPASTPPVAAAATTGTPEVPVGLGGFAEMYVATYLTADGPSGEKALRRFNASSSAAATGGDTRFVLRTATLEADMIDDGYWSVTVAADVLADGGDGYVAEPTHHYMVGVVVTGHGMAAAGMPERVAGPPAAPIVAVAGTTPVEDAAVTTLVRTFIDALIVGNGDLAAVTTDGSDITPVRPPPFTAVEITALSVTDSRDGSMVTVSGTGTVAPGVVRPIEYHLVVAADEGTLLIDAISPGPLLAGD